MGAFLAPYLFLTYVGSWSSSLSMESWYRSDVTYACMEGLIKRGLLRGRIDTMEWLVLSHKEVPMPPNGYIVSFMPFHERGLMIPPHLFFWGLLHHYQIELRHLNPNGIQHVVAFIVMCEGYLVIKPYFELWRYFFAISLHRKKDRGREIPVPMV